MSTNETCSRIAPLLIWFRGIQYITATLKFISSDPSGPLGLCAARYLQNVFAMPGGRWALFYVGNRLVLPTVGQCLKTTANKNCRIALSSVLLNLASAVFEKGQAAVDETSPYELLHLLRDCIPVVQISGDNDSLYRLLVAMSTLLSCGFVKKEKMEINFELLDVTDENCRGCMSDLKNLL